MTIFSQCLAWWSRSHAKTGCWWVGFSITAVFGHTAQPAGLAFGLAAMEQPAMGADVGVSLPASFVVPTTVVSLEFPDRSLGNFSVYLKRGRATPGEIRDLLTARETGGRSSLGEVITMEPYVVLERTQVEYVLPPHRNRVIEAIKTGQIWKHVGRVVTSEASARIESDRGGYSRFTVRLGISW